MTRFVALLRAVNVSGKNIVKMETLRQKLADLPFQNVSTYIQSGNILFDTDLSKISAETAIADLIQKHFHLEITVIVLEPKDLVQALADNPFADKSEDDGTQPYIGFLSEVPTEEGIAKLREVDFQNDEWIVSGKRIYYWYADSAANTKLSNAVVEKKLGVRSTARNSKTVRKLIALCGL